eukprot:18293-Heterococcus_DN1.PRE.2
MASFARPQNSQKYEVPADVKAAFTADELKQYLRTFKGFDSDSDGSIEHNEIKAALGQMGEKTLALVSAAYIAQTTLAAM